MRSGWLCIPVVLALAVPAHASNGQAGRNEGRSRQKGESRSGDVIGGPGLAVIRSGDVEVESVNRSGNGSSFRSRITATSVQVNNFTGSIDVTSGSASNTDVSDLFAGLDDSGVRRTLAAVFGAALSP